MPDKKLVDIYPPSIIDPLLPGGIPSKPDGTEKAVAGRQHLTERRCTMSYPYNTEEDRKRIEKDFTYHPPTLSQVPRYNLIRDFARTFAYRIVENCPPSTERSLALTALEESVMWANASIARNETNEPPAA